jgi:hypothetical protein
MFRSSILVFAVAMVPFAAAGSAQTIAEQLEKGIYAQETASDTDEAIRIFRQILGSAPAQRGVAAEAQYRLALALLEKGDMNGSAVEFQRLAASYPEHKDLIASLAARRASRTQSTGSTISRGTLFVNRSPDGKSGRYISRLTGIEFSFTDGWDICGDYPSSDGGEQVCLSDRVSRSSGFIWMKPDGGSGDRESELRNDLVKKPSQRGADWKPRPESVQLRSTAGEPALSAIADYMEDGRRMVEYCTWIRGAKARLFYSMRMPADDFPLYQSRFGQLIATVKLP